LSFELNIVSDNIINRGHYGLCNKELLSLILNKLNVFVGDQIEREKVERVSEKEQNLVWNLRPPGPNVM
jgi:hypothetical protein